MDVVDTGRRRRWSPEEKLRIVEESLAGHRSASAVARANGIAASQLFAWRKQLCEPAAGFARAIVSSDAATAGGRMEVVCANGRRVLIGANVDVDALVRVVAALER